MEEFNYIIYFKFMGLFIYLFGSLQVYLMLSNMSKNIPLYLKFFLTLGYFLLIPIALFFKNERDLTINVFKKNYCLKYKNKIINGKKHQIKLLFNGDIKYFHKGKIHRDDGKPAYISKDRKIKMFYYNGDIIANKDMVKFFHHKNVFSKLKNF